MRRFLLSVAGLGLAVAFAAVPPPPQNITLLFDAPTNSGPVSNLVYRIRATNDISAPLATWPVALVITNNSSNTVSVVLQVVPGERYYTVTASNLFFESDFSNTASTPQVPAVQTLSISKGP